MKDPDLCARESADLDDPELNETGAALLGLSLETESLTPLNQAEFEKLASSRSVSTARLPGAKYLAGQMGLAVVPMPIETREEVELFERLLTPYLGTGRAIPFDRLRDQYNVAVREHIDGLLKSGKTASDSALRFKTTAFITEYATSMAKRIAAQEALQPHDEFLSLAHHLVRPARGFPPVSTVGAAPAAAPAGACAHGASLTVQSINVGAPVLCAVPQMRDETPANSLNRWRTTACNELGWDADIVSVNKRVLELALSDHAAGRVWSASN